MSEDKHPDADPERTLITLDQLSQTIEVMTSVVNRLRQHLSEQLKAQIEAQRQPSQPDPATVKETAKPADNPQQATKTSQQKESFVVEISQQDSEPVRKNSKTLH